MIKIQKLQILDVNKLDKTACFLDELSPYVLECNNWAEQYPYAPQVAFHIAHNGQYLFIKFKVSEQHTMALVAEDNGEVWTDSCVEFFLALDDTGYYNFEFTCIGKALLGFRKERPNPIHATPEIMASILRLPTLEMKTFEEKTGDNNWGLTVAIPVTALFKHSLTNFSGLTATANVYKCGDNLSKPHFLSWQPINTPKPDFHVPQFFTEVEFE